MVDIEHVNRGKAALFENLNRGGIELITSFSIDFAGFEIDGIARHITPDQGVLRQQQRIDRLRKFLSGTG